MKSIAFLLHALSPLHVGTGQSVEVIDLPIARMRSTGMPIVPGASIRGVLRYVRGPSTKEEPRIARVFGPESSDDDGFAGALTVGDARLLALPVRSFRGTFAWVSSPLLLGLAARDLLEAGFIVPSIPHPGEKDAAVTPGSQNLHQERVYLEDLDLVGQKSAEVDAWAKLLGPVVAPEGNLELFTRRFLVVHDEIMTFLWETATQVDARIRLNPATRTVAKGALWYEESLPPETLLIGLMSAAGSFKPGDRPSGGGRGEGAMSAQEVIDFALPAAEQILQFGGKAGTGRGRCRVARLNGGGAA